jgi:peroxiredoxin
MPSIMSSAKRIAWLACLALSTELVAAESMVPSDAKNIKPLTVGASAPAVTLRKADGSRFDFRPDKLTQPVMIIFYRGGWCPYCNTQLGQLSKLEGPLQELGYQVLFFSADKPELLYASLKDPTIKYTLLSDNKMAGARAFGVAFRVDSTTVEQYKKFGVDLEKASGESHHELPVPSVFIVDNNGIIRFSYANPDYRVRIPNDELLAAARRAVNR